MKSLVVVVGSTKSNGFKISGPDRIGFFLDLVDYPSIINELYERLYIGVK